MKPGLITLRLLLMGILPVLTNCASSQKTAPSTSPTTASAPAVKTEDAVDELDDYSSTEVSDPLEKLNRATFQLNDGLYNFVFRPVSKGYVFVTPKPVRQGLDNFFDNVKFPVRFVNCGLQGKFNRAGLEFQKFGINTIGGLAGFIRLSDKIPSLVAVPSEDTGQTLAKWGLGHGPYLVLPVLGPSSFRETLGYGGDYALNPIHWGFLLKGDTNTWAWIPSTVNTIRSLPGQLMNYDESRKNSVDPYLSVRSIYIQNRNSAAQE